MAIFGLLPLMLGVPRAGGPGRMSSACFWGGLVVSAGVWAVMDHGHASHHAMGQVAGLGVLLAWVPLLLAHLGGYAWPEPARPWLRWAAVWWTLLVVSGWAAFLPGMSERLKFTHALVAHAHLAMAGLITSVHFAILAVLDGRPTRRGVLAWWQGGCVAHVGALAGLGWVETAHEADVFMGAGWVEACFVVRLLAGGAMLGAAVVAWRDAVRTREGAGGPATLHSAAVGTAGVWA